MKLGLGDFWNESVCTFLKKDNLKNKYVATLSLKQLKDNFYYKTGYFFPYNFFKKIKWEVKNAIYNYF